MPTGLRLRPSVLAAREKLAEAGAAFAPFMHLSASFGSLWRVWADWIMRGWIHNGTVADLFRAHRVIIRVHQNGDDAQAVPVLVS